jgi:hypothetical protein
MAVGYKHDEWYWSAASGNEPNKSVTHKYGRNVDVDTAAREDIWDGGGTWVAPTQARIHAIVSTSDVDGKTGSPASAGARTLRVYGLTDWDTDEVSEDITLDGTTAVNTTNSYVIIHRMKVLTMGASGPNVGTITATAATDGTVTAQISIGAGQTLMCVYGVPSTKIVYLFNHYGSVHKKTSASIDLLLMINEDPTAELVGGFLTKNVIGPATAGASFAEYTHLSPSKYLGPLIIKLSANTSANDTDVSGGFDMVLIDA